MIKNIYKSESRIYIGTNSRVIKCYNNKQNEYNALKIFTEQNKNDFYNELKIINMFAPNIENINKFIEYFEFNNELWIFGGSKNVHVPVLANSDQEDQEDLNKYQDLLHYKMISLFKIS